MAATTANTTRLELDATEALAVKQARFPRAWYSTVRGSKGTVLLVVDEHLPAFRAFLKAVSAPAEVVVVATEVNAAGNTVRVWSNGDRTELIDEAKLAF